MPLGIGDDAAEITVAGSVIACTDVIVEGVHFRIPASGGADIGHKAAAVNLSDLAAMGARPRALLVALTLGPSAPEVSALYDGLTALAGAHGSPVVGGDISSGPATSLAVTALGDLPGGRRPVRRDGATAGDRIWVTGPLGAAAAGLCLVEGSVTEDVVTGERPDLVAHQLRPEPRVDAGCALADAGAHAMIDLSDGLAIDAGRLARASGVRLVIDADSVPRARGVDAVARALGQEPVAFACTGGEDYELLVCGDEALPERSGVDLVPIGRVEAGAGAVLTSAGSPLDLGAGGYLHAV